MTVIVSWSVLFHRGNRQEGWPAVTEREVLNFLVRTGTVNEPGGTRWDTESMLLSMTTHFFAFSHPTKLNRKFILIPECVQ